jgi:hypothetical protein
MPVRVASIKDSNVKGHWTFDIGHPNATTTAIPKGENVLRLGKLCPLANISVRNF